MAEIRHLKNAPITEAMVDFRVKLPKDFKAEQFLPLKERIKDRYPTNEEARGFKGGIKIEKGVQISQFAESTGLQGLLFKSEDAKNIAQFRSDGFTFNRLQPYTSWGDVFPEARKLWGSYLEIAAPEMITRIAVRYINHLRIPLPIRDLAQYVTAPPTVPHDPSVGFDIPEHLSSFLMRMRVHEPESKIAANITQAFEESVDPEYAIIILDIDVYLTAELAVNDQVIIPVFDQMHDMKNTIFFNSITEDTARLFE